MTESELQEIETCVNKHRWAHGIDLVVNILIAEIRRLKRGPSEDALISWAEERAQNYKDCYLPSWALDDWQDSDTQFLSVYMRTAMRDFLSAWRSSWNELTRENET